MTKSIDFSSDKDFCEIFGALLNEMVVVHRCTFEEAFHIVHDEIRREYDRRVQARRASLRVIQG
jgi:hypothetical protein